MNTMILAFALGATLDVNSFTYDGSFRLSEQWAPNNQTLEYSNGCFCVLPNGNLLVTGHIYGSLVREFVVPAALAKTKIVSAMPTAASSGAWVNLKAGLNVTGQQIWGMTYRPQDGRIWFQDSTDYQDVNSPLKALCSTPWPSVAPQGPWSVSSSSVWNTGKYLCAMPDGRLLIGRRRQSWGASEGHNASYVTVPASLPAAGASLPGVLAMSYCGWTGSNTAACYSKEQSQADNYSAVAFVEGTIILSCLKDWDPARWYYGYENWKAPDECEPSGTCQGQRGHRAGDARPTLLLIDPAAMAGGDTDWFAKVDLAPFFSSTYGPTFLSTGAEADTVFSSYDATRKRLYVSESYAEANRPVVHVFSVAGGTVVVPPPPPPVPVPVVPTKVVISWQHEGKDLNGQAITIDKAEAKIVKRGAGSSVTPVFLAAASGREVVLGAGTALVDGDYDGWIRCHGSAGWSGYYGPVPFRWPPSEPQPIPPPFKATVPARPMAAKAELKP